MSDNAYISGSRNFVHKTFFAKEVFWLRVGWFLTGCLFMAILDFTDIHICIGECDAAGYDIVDFPKFERR